MRKLPKLEIITRDRYGKYSRAATKGAPQTIQVTDRCHLLKNLGEALTKMMTREYTRLNRSLAPKIEESPVEIPDGLPVREKEVASTGIIRQQLHAKYLGIKKISNCITQKL